MNRRLAPIFAVLGVCCTATLNPYKEALAQPPAPTPLFGFADLHTHQFADRGLGGLVIWGSPFTLDDDPEKALPWSDFMPAFPFPVVGVGDIPAPVIALPAWRPGCPFGTGAPPLLPCPVVAIHGPFGSLDLLNPALGGRWPHGVGGYSQFDGWPAFDVLTAQQMYYQWLHRAWQGGLRLMTMLAVNNAALCMAVYHFADFGCADMPAVERQIQGAKDLEAFIDRQDDGEANGSGWYRIVYSGAQARQVVAEGKLAVVLGVEVPALLGCTIPAANRGECAEQSVRAGVQQLYDLGVRHVFPIHNADNAFGGSALYNDIFDINSAIYNEGTWMSIGSCPQNADGNPDNDIRFHMDLRDLIYAFQHGVSNALDGLSPFTRALLQISGFLATPAPPGANCNPRGLQPLGRVLIEELVAHKMIIDVDHTSTITLDDILSLLETWSYPGVSMGHTGIREMGVDDGAYKTETNRHEGNKETAQLRRIRDLGGVVAVILHQGGTDKTAEYRRGDGSAPVPFTCGDSSEAWAQPYLFVADLFGPDAALALGSDFNGLAGEPAPRFGADACHSHPPPGYSPANPVSYPFELHGQPGAFMDQHVFFEKTYDYNTHGMAHVGMYPDFIEDLKKIGFSDRDLDPLFRSADAYVRMWESVEDVTPPVIQCAAPDGTWHAQDVSIACTAYDVASGLNASSPAAFSLTTSVAAGQQTANATTDSRTICDRRGNCATAGPITGIKVDKKAPEVAVLSPADGATFDTGSQISLNYSASDGDGSGTASSVITLDGLPASNSQSIDAFFLAPGVHTIVASAADQVGNTATLTTTFRVNATAESLMANVDKAFALGLIRDATVYQGLKDKLVTARNAHVRGRHPTEWNILEAFIHQVVAQREHWIETATADRLIAYARDIIDRKA